MGSGEGEREKKGKCVSRPGLQPALFLSPVTAKIKQHILHLLD